MEDAIDSFRNVPHIISERDIGDREIRQCVMQGLAISPWIFQRAYSVVHQPFLYRL